VWRFIRFGKGLDQRESEVYRNLQRLHGLKKVYLSKQEKRK